MPVARVFARLGVLDLIRDCDRHPTRLDALRAAAENLGVATLPATDDGEPGRGAVTATSEGR